MAKPIDKPIDKPERVEYYIAQTHLVNDKTEREYDKGDTVTSRDFSHATIKNWLEIGVLILKESEA